MLFKNKNTNPEHSGMKTAEDTTIENHNIISRLKTGNTILCDYSHLDTLTNLKSEIDSFLANFADCPGSIDEGNGDILNNLIADRLKEDLNNIDSQYKKRIIQIQSMCAITEADKARKSEEYEDLRAKLAEIDEHLKKLKDNHRKTKYNF